MPILAAIMTRKIKVTQTAMWFLAAAALFSVVAAGGLHHPLTHSHQGQDPKSECGICLLVAQGFSNCAFGSDALAAPNDIPRAVKSFTPSQILTRSTLTSCPQRAPPTD